jgi:hypothetical protein
MPASEVDLEFAHTLSDNHRERVLHSDRVGCFYCGCVYPPDRIHEWIDAGQTAVCPYCGIDSVIAGNTGLLDEEFFLERMHIRWFGDPEGRVAKAIDGLRILSTPSVPCGVGGCKCGCIFCPFCGCHMNNIEPGEDGHTDRCPWVKAFIACGLGTWAYP